MSKQDGSSVCARFLLAEEAKSSTQMPRCRQNKMTCVSSMVVRPPTWHRLMETAWEQARIHAVGGGITPLPLSEHLKAEDVIYEGDSLFTGATA